MATPEGAPKDVHKYVRVGPSGEHHNPELMACWVNHHCLLSITFSNERTVSIPVRRRTMKSTVCYFAANVSVLLTNVSNCHQ